MCGIIGYVGDTPALPILLDGLRRLEYRGYDSAGLAISGSDKLLLEKRAGRVAVLARATVDATPALAQGHAGIAHTRWATHGAPCDINAHPHTDERSQVAVVHNGIIENHHALRRELEASGHRLQSETDSEVVAHLIESALPRFGGTSEKRLRQAVSDAVGRLRGSFALAVLWHKAPGILIGVRHRAPLVVGVTATAHFVASDVAALLPYTHEIIVLGDGELAVLHAGAAQLYSFEGISLAPRPTERVPWDIAAAERGGYEHFMLKEIHEQPQALEQTLSGRAFPAHLREVPLGQRAWLLGCGTAYHAALVGRHLLESWARIPAEADLGSEFRYRDPLVAPGDVAIAVSQSGETADTLAALEQARQGGAHTLAVTNVMGSTLGRQADQAIYTWAGPEIAVCSTKAYTTQVAVLALLALEAAVERGAMAPDAALAWSKAILRLPSWATEALGLEEETRRIAGWLADRAHAFFIGRGLDAAIALEGQLKLKEVSYIPAEGYAAGELKHGALALVDEGTAVIALFTQPHLAEKMAGNVAEVRARGGRVVALATRGLASFAEPLADELLVLPDVPGALAPAVAVIPLQLLAYYTAIARGTDVDKPRNLAKSVTVE